MLITADELRKLLHYNSKTGVFTRLIKRTTGGSGFLHHSGYRYICVEGKTYAAHRLAWLYMIGEWPKYDIDHFNGIKNDNRFCNLRDVPKCINMQNERKARKNNKSGFMGVRFRKDRNKWTAAIRVNGKAIRLGSFKTPEEAEQAYIEGKKEYHPGFTK